MFAVCLGVDDSAGDPSAHNPYWNELPLSYRLWPDEAWPPQLGSLSGHAVQYEADRLFAKFYEQEKEHWD